MKRMWFHSWEYVLGLGLDLYLFCDPSKDVNINTRLPDPTNPDQIPFIKVPVISRLTFDFSSDISSSISCIEFRKRTVNIGPEHLCSYWEEL